MCGRFLLDGDIEDIISKYNLSDTIEVYYTRKPEIFPTDTVPVIVNGGFNELKLMRWGFVPTAGKGLVINAKSETIEEKNMFKASFLTRRCIIPANAFFEWKEVERGKKDKYKIIVRDLSLFSMAGIYDEFIDKEGKSFMAFTIITTAANEVMAHIHDRMPVILSSESEELWLNSELRDVSQLKSLLKPLQRNINVAEAK